MKTVVIVWNEFPDNTIVFRIVMTDPEVDRVCKLAGVYGGSGVVTEAQNQEIIWLYRMLRGSWAYGRTWDDSLQNLQPIELAGCHQMVITGRFK